MAELLTTKEILAALDSIIKKAEKYICIFTYNIKIDPNYLSRLRNASKRNVAITIVFGVDNGDPAVLKEVMSLPNATVYFKEYLHAKFYYNEKELLVGSMNLSEASAKNNFELGVLFTGQEYQSVIGKVKAEAKEIVGDAIKFSGPEPPRPTSTIGPTAGICIRCAIPIELNPHKPLCRNCYSEWAEWENEYYQEEFCHRCGQEMAGISYAYPQCNKCYKQYMRTTKGNALAGPPNNAISNLQIDRKVKDILVTKLKLNRKEISIDFDLQGHLQKTDKRLAVISELEKQFEINLGNCSTKVRDYWDLYSAVASAIKER